MHFMVLLENFQILLSALLHFDESVADVTSAGPLLAASWLTAGSSFAEPMGSSTPAGVASSVHQDVFEMPSQGRRVAEPAPLEHLMTGEP